MPKVDFTSGSGRVLEEPLYLNFAASHPQAGPVIFERARLNFVSGCSSRKSSNS